MDETVMRRVATQDGQLGADSGAFLDAPARDILAPLDPLTALPDGLQEEIERLMRGVPVAHDEPLDGVVEI